MLKQLQRKERALRKLEAMEANLTCVADLTGEISPPAHPPGRQAEAARKAAVIQAEARDVPPAPARRRPVQLTPRSSRRSPTRPSHRAALDLEQTSPTSGRG